ncbi:MAG TPA: ATP-binding protein, partial [Candidatus Nitrosotenuis sp.]|nr:ATP-binding protein [Candidatus Nitrosotenuis sp.]
WQALVPPRPRRPEPGCEDLAAARLYSRLAYAYWFNRGTWATLWAHMRELNLAERYPGTAELAQACSEHAPAMTMLPWFGRGIRYVERSLALRRQLGDAWGQGQSLHFYAILLLAAARFREALEKGQEALRILERSGDRWEVHNSLYQIALSQYRLGDLEAAVQTARRLHDMAREIGDHQAVGLSLDAWSRASEGRLPVHLVLSSLDMARRDPLTTVLVMQARGVQLLARGREDEAVAVLSEAAALVRRHGMRQEYVASVLPWLATALRRQAEGLPLLAAGRRRQILARARRVARSALRGARLFRSNLPHALREVGLVAALEGEAARARQLLGQSLAVAERQEARYEEMLSRQALARLERALASACRPPGPALLTAVPEAPEGPVTLSLLDRFHSIIDAGRRIASALTREAVLEAAREAALTLLRAEHCTLLEVAEDGQIRSRDPDSYPFNPELVGQAAASGQPALLQDEGQDVPGSSALCLPILARGRCSACLYAAHAQVGGLFGDEEQRLARFISTLAGVALENAEGLARERRRLEERTEQLVDSENRFRHLVESLQAVVWQAQAQTLSFTFVSPQAQAMLGYPVARWSEPGFFASILHPQDRERVLAFYTQASGGASGLEYRVLAADGREVWLHDTVRVLCDRLGRPRELLGVMVDVTARRRAEEEDRRRQEELRQVQKMEAVGRLAGGVAHDFNNLLLAIELYCSLLLERFPAGEPARAEVEAIQSAASRAASLTRQLLTFGRRQMRAPRWLDLNAVLQNLQKILERVLGEDVRLILRLDPSTPRVLADLAEIEQVVLNLVVNARDAMPSGGELTLETSRTEEGQALLAVLDTGCGMDSETLSRAFEPFFTTKPAGVGTGLGLSTTYAVVSQCGGSIRIDSQPGQGTAVRIWLPGGVSEGEEAPASGGRSRRPAEGETILVVEDEATVRKLVRQVLEREGYRVLVAADGQEALELCRSHPGLIDLLLTDVVMPGLSGPQVASRARELRPFMQVLYMSGYNDDRLLRHGIEESSVAFLQKPFTAEVLAERVRELLDSREDSRP